MLDRADCADFGCHNSIRLETKHFLNTLALTFISFSGRFVFAILSFFFASDPLVFACFELSSVQVFFYVFYCVSKCLPTKRIKTNRDPASAGTSVFLLTHKITALPVGNLARVMTPVSLLRAHVQFVLLS